MVIEPNKLAILKGRTIVEAISYPTTSGRVLVRLVKGCSWSALFVDVSDVEPLDENNFEEFKNSFLD